MTDDKVLTGLTALLMITGLGLVGWVFFKSHSSNTTSYSSVSDCVTGTLTKTMDDPLMSGIFEKGEEYQVLKNYYNCNPVERGDLVWFRISAANPPVVKIVYGIPGDRFEVLEDAQTKKRWQVKINNHFIENKTGRLYFDSENSPPLKTYEVSRKGVLKDGEYIIFSNVSPGSSDSSQLGLVRKRSFDGKVNLPAQ